MRLPARAGAQLKALLVASEEARGVEHKDGARNALEAHADAPAGEQEQEQEEQEQGGEALGGPADAKRGQGLLHSVLRPAGGGSPAAPSPRARRAGGVKQEPGGGGSRGEAPPPGGKAPRPPLKRLKQAGAG